MYRQIRAAVLDGRLRKGDRLPPTRELAERLGVARNTVALAYEWLTAEGLLSGRAGAGSFVEGAPVTRARAVAAAPLRPRAVWDTLTPLEPGSPPAPGELAFEVGVPDARHFPFDTWRRLLGRELRASALPATYGEPAGHPRLRAAIAHHLGVARGVRATADDVVVTQGAQQALDLLGRVLLEPGARVAVEEPGYPPARHAFESQGARVAGVRVDAEGLDVAALPAGVRLVYVTPSHQFPLGMPMSHARRIALLAWAERHDAVVVEDDYDSEFRFGGRPVDPLQVLDRSGRVAYVGTFSKVALPGLRLGFVVAPPSLRRALRAAAAVSGGFGTWPVQGAMARFLEEGLLARHVRRARREYALRHARIVEALEGELAPWLEPVPSAVGLHVAAWLRRGGAALEREVRMRARAAGVRVGGLSAFHREPGGRAGLVLGYGALPTARVDEGLRRLRTCLAAARPR